MKNIVIFSGTTEGRLLAESFACAGIASTVCVATDYGEEVMKPDPLIEVHIGRLDETEMESFFKEKNTDLVFDATHPYAVEASRNIKMAASSLGIDYRRIERERTSHEPDFNVSYVKDTAEAVKLLESSESRILLTTGSKELKYFAGFRDRLYVRVLPSIRAIELCEQAGIEKSHIIAEQGPFTYEENLALLKRYDIGLLVTKASGKAGGYDQKIRAAQAAGVSVITIERRQDQAVSVPEKSITVIGAGCGERTLTLEAANAIRNADIIIASERLLNYPLVKSNPCVKVKAFMPDDIADAIAKSGCSRAVVLFSGDSGFYSGAKGLLSLEEKNGIKIRVLPGISSVQMLSSATHLPYDGAAIRSYHGKTLKLNEIKETVENNRLSYFLFSGKSDASAVSDFLKDMKVQIFTGKDLGSAGQRIFEGKLPEDLPERALYITVVKNLCVE
ncbi:MAG: precorrin-6A reductase [Lachnospiraceae bacterium]|uniref:Precorrin-6A reductase n=1 Tax=Candidatus Weimeria bifida TaxID=2599074 RepID=A0A6N7IZ54_9FIRM|nr:precorrin-6A reductase [Candidatus Weimeria bifida]RRF97221.1 MAG: precorrin-6A reductase [Lachnospiraceae bacterium]